jgi:hypothetical protein
VREIVYRIAKTAALVILGIFFFFGTNAIYLTAPTDFNAGFGIMFYLGFSFFCFGYAIWINASGLIIRFSHAVRINARMIIRELENLLRKHS